MSQIQDHLSAEADKIIRSSSAPFGSAVLVNRLSTLSLSIPPVKSNTLVEPIIRRRNQLATDVAPLMQSKGRWIVYQSYLGAAGGVAASWAAYVPPLELITSSTAFGLGLLSVVASIYAGQTRWMKAQKGFWRSWDRTTEMLGSDINVSQQTLRRHRQG